MNLTSIKLSIEGAHAWATVDGPLTSGMVGIPVTIEYDEAWDGLTKNLMCRCSTWGSNGGEIRTLLNVGETSTVAHEVMQPDMYLYLGVEGFSDDGALVIPTTWARCGKIEYGANTCEDPSTDPELPIWNQLQTEVAQIKRDGYTQEQIDKIQAYAQSASQSATRAERAEGNSIAASNLSVSNTNLAEIHAKQAQASAENAKTSASSAANLANGALQAQQAAEAAAERAEAAADSERYGTLSAAQINALDGMFQAAAYDADSNYSAAYASFRTTFGLSVPDSGGDSGGSNESAWTDGVAYEWENITGEYVDATDGSFVTYSGWSRTPYMACCGATVLRAEVIEQSASMSRSNSAYNVFYDTDRQFISAFAAVDTDAPAVGAYTDIEIPANAAYFIVSHKSNVMGENNNGIPYIRFIPYREVPV